MPRRAPRLCSCGKIVPGGELCACQVTRKAAHDRIRPNARQRGYTTKWDRARAAYLSDHRKCVFCGDPASVVDHRIAHKGDQKLFWSRTNWQPLCGPCHNSTKQSLERRP
nr:HNH endonuclease signature motif containing protein [Rhodoligotrophos appendicifer]